MNIENRQGKHVSGQGTGFDLAELVSHPLVIGNLLNLSAIQYVRVIDVIGNGSTFDAFGRPIYDPYPTAFASGGFDLAGMGVLHIVPEPSTVLLLSGGLLWFGRSAGDGNSSRIPAGSARPAGPGATCSSSTSRRGRPGSAGRDPGVGRRGAGSAWCGSAARYAP